MAVMCATEAVMGATAMCATAVVTTDMDATIMGAMGATQRGAAIMGAMGATTARPTATAMGVMCAAVRGAAVMAHDQGAARARSRRR